MQAVANLRYRGENTNTTGGIRAARTIFTDPFYQSRPDVPKVCFVVTDGKPTYSSELLPSEVVQIKALPVRMVTIGITNQVRNSRDIHVVPLKIRKLFIAIV